jgi:8-oxo-dGTP diphosphatase
VTQVVAGIIERDGRILICRRRADQAHALKWEFPGGKVEPGESAGEALRRELAEELAIEIDGCEEIGRYQFAYPGKPPIELAFLRVNGYRGAVANLIFEEVAWAPRPRLAEYDFLEGDLPFLASAW